MQVAIIQWLLFPFCLVPIAFVAYLFALICFILGSYLTLKSSMEQNKYFIKQVENVIISHTNFLVHDDTIINDCTSFWGISFYV